MENIALVMVKIAAAEAPKAVLRPPRPTTSSRPGASKSSASHGKNGTAATPSLGVKFVSAGLAACVADAITFPLDTAKVRLQLQGEAPAALTAARSGAAALAKNSGVAVVGAAAQQGLKYRGIVGTILTISRQEGSRALYSGFAAGLQRQMCFASVRIGLYDSVKQFYIKLFKAEGTVGSQNVGLRILAGITTGGAAVVCGQPTDVVKVRMQAQGAGKAKRYQGCIHAYRTIAMQEGVRGLWKGTLPNITRNAVVNAAELVSYDLIKEAILHHRLMSDSMPCHFTSAFGAGFVATVIASPVDVVKTRFMNSEPGVYSGAFNCAVRMYRQGGFKAFYKGFMPSFIRLGSWNIVMFVSFEQLKRFFTDVNARPPVLPDVNLVTAKPKRFM